MLDISERLDPNGAFSEMPDFYGSAAEVCEDLFSRTLTYVLLLNKNQPVIRIHDFLISREEATPAQIRAFCRPYQKMFLKGLSQINFRKTQPLESFDKNFIETLMFLAQGDWTDALVISNLMDCYNKVLDSLFMPNGATEDSTSMQAAAASSDRIKLWKEGSLINFKFQNPND